jgi:hypothetical protein
VLPQESLHGFASTNAGIVTPLHPASIRAEEMIKRHHTYKEAVEKVRTLSMLSFFYLNIGI